MNRIHGNVIDVWKNNSHCNGLDKLRGFNFPDMLYEIQKIKQNDGEPRRRWFIDDYFDLIVWLSEADEIEGFQLCYDKTRNQHALTWSKSTGYMHNSVDSGEDKPGKPKGIPLLVADGDFQHEEIANRFRKESKKLEQRISDLVCEKIMQYSMSTFKMNVDVLAIRQAALDYIEGEYEGDAEKMLKVLHPEVVRREFITDPKTGKDRLEQKSGMSMVKGASASSETPRERLKKDISILETFEKVASVKAASANRTDYIHMVKFDKKWMIVNVLRTLN
ncbi:MAG: hypothetical protein B6245_05140 [Desulfobacteraceae bacterium 4572_88]|nr:MAG: hypothetical protein B6245_05140 [Desulfobacteraceae bacterium 4572_88]RLC19844.1 MAG: hypothetical protein DRI57_06180 [Deltaproteobacteria bacterium]